MNRQFKQKMKASPIPTSIKRTMHTFWFVATITSTVFSGSVTAHACFARAEQDLRDIKYADVVLVGRILNYKIVRDEKFRLQRQGRLEKLLSQTDLTSDQRTLYENMLEIYKGSGGILTDYARFDIEVDKVLFGKVEGVISVTWNNSTFGEPKAMSVGPHLIALRKPSSKLPPLRGPSATMVPSLEPNELTVLQAPCSSPFIFESSGNKALKVREFLNAE